MSFCDLSRTILKAVFCFGNSSLWFHHCALGKVTWKPSMINDVHWLEPSRMEYLTKNQHSLNAKQTIEHYNMLRMIKATDIDVVQQINCNSEDGRARCWYHDVMKHKQWPTATFVEQSKVYLQSIWCLKSIRHRWRLELHSLEKTRLIYNKLKYNDWMKGHRNTMTEKYNKIIDGIRE